MRIIDRKTFFEGYRRKFGKLVQKQVDALEYLIRCLEVDDKMMDIRWCAYALATVKWETDSTFRPIEEYGRGKGRAYGIEIGGKVYFGRGLVQLTWIDNYRTMGGILDIDLVGHPELALEPEIAYKILSIGMRNGSFTGRRLGQYINDGGCNYIMARKIINSQDHAKEIAKIAETFEAILTVEA